MDIDMEGGGAEASLELVRFLRRVYRFDRIFCRVHASGPFRKSIILVLVF